MPERSIEPLFNPGDRVTLELPVFHHTNGHVAMGWVTGTVIALDEHGLPPGVRVKLDATIGGTSDCYASRQELRVIDAG